MLVRQPANDSDDWLETQGANLRCAPDAQKMTRARRDYLGATIVQSVNGTAVPPRTIVGIT